MPIIYKKYGIQYFPFLCSYWKKEVPWLSLKKMVPTSLSLSKTGQFYFSYPVISYEYTKCRIYTYPHIFLENTEHQHCAVHLSPITCLLSVLALYAVWVPDISSLGIPGHPDVGICRDTWSFQGSS